MPKCDLNDCSLTADVQIIKTNQVSMAKAQNDMNTTQQVFIQKMNDYVKNGEKEHEILFVRTRLAVKWPHLATVIFVLSAIIGIVWKLASGS